MTTRLSLNTLWKRWRDHRLAPRMRKGSIDEDIDDAMEEDPTNENEAETDAALSSQDTVCHATGTRRVLLSTENYQHAPLSPLPNESDFSKDATQTPMIPDSPDDYDYTLTPPAFQSPMEMVSAKKMTSDLRNKRKRKQHPLVDQTNYYPASEEEQEPEEWTQDTSLLSPNARSQHYWNICYGNAHTITTGQSSWSAQRLPPTKSCVSHRKPTRNHSLPTLAQTPRLPIRSTTLDPQLFCYKTPTIPTTSTTFSHSATARKAVQFGAPSAAEFDQDVPTLSALKRLPHQEVQERYSLFPPKQTRQEEEETNETKNNSKILAAWESAFDNDDDNNDDDSIGMTEKLHQREILQSKRIRRSSTLFSPQLKALLVNHQDSPLAEQESQVVTQDDDDNESNDAQE